MISSTLEHTEHAEAPKTSQTSSFSTDPVYRWEGVNRWQKDEENNYFYLELLEFVLQMHLLIFSEEHTEQNSPKMNILCTKKWELKWELNNIH